MMFVLTALFLTQILFNSKLGLKNNGDEQSPIYGDVSFASAVFINNTDTML